MGYTGTELPLIETEYLPCAQFGLSSEANNWGTKQIPLNSSHGMESQASCLLICLGPVLENTENCTGTCEKGKGWDYSGINFLSQGIPRRKLHPRLVESLQKVCFELDSDFRVQSKSTPPGSPQVFPMRVFAPSLTILQNFGWASIVHLICSFLCCSQLSLGCFPIDRSFLRARTQLLDTAGTQ